MFLIIYYLQISVAGCTTRTTSQCPIEIWSLSQPQTKSNPDRPINGDSMYMWRTSTLRGFPTSELPFWMIIAKLLLKLFLFFANRIVSNKYPISALEWDVVGKHLLVCDISGHCQIWSQRDNLLSDWLQLYESHFAGEHIVQAAFFHNGQKTAFMADKKEVTNYIDKFQRVKFTPSVVQFGLDFGRFRFVYFLNIFIFLRSQGCSGRRCFCRYGHWNGGRLPDPNRQSIRGQRHWINAGRSEPVAVNGTVSRDNG